MWRTYFELGFQHICDWQAYDHMLFLLALTASYALIDWKKILYLVTAFTIGHATTLLFSALDVLTINKDLVEFLIPISIIAVCLFNLWNLRSKSVKRNIRFAYIMALLFGFLHGMGFANYFKAIIMKSEHFVPSLLAFNFGVEAGQIVIVMGLLLLSFILNSLAKIPFKYWTITASCLAAGLALYLMVA